MDIKHPSTTINSASFFFGDVEDVERQLRYEISYDIRSYSLTFKKKYGDV